MAKSNYYYNKKNKIIIKLDNVSYFKEKKGKVIVVFNNFKKVIIQDTYENIMEALLND